MNGPRGFAPCALVLLASVGCEAPVTTPAAPQPMVAVLPHPRAQVWKALSEGLGMEFPLQIVDEESGLLATRPTAMALPASRWALGCENPADFGNAWNQLRLTLRVQVEKREPGRTQVTLTCHYQANKQSTWPSAWTVVGSNGVLERLILDRLQTRLQAPEVK